MALWSDYGGRTWLRFVRLSTLDEPHAFAPDVHIFTRSKLPWMQVPKRVPASNAFYKLDDVWPAESLQRFRVNRAA